MCFDYSFKIDIFYMTLDTYISCMDYLYLK